MKVLCCRVMASSATPGSAMIFSPLRRALELKPDYHAAHNNLLFSLQYCTGVTLAALAEMHAEYDRRMRAALSAVAEHEQIRDRGGRLRLGFVSPDLGQHPVGYFLVRVLENLPQIPAPREAAAGAEGSLLPSPVLGRGRAHVLRENTNVSSLENIDPRNRTTHWLASLPRPLSELQAPRCLHHQDPTSGLFLRPPISFMVPVKPKLHDYRMWPRQGLLNVPFFSLWSERLAVAKNGKTFSSVTGPITYFTSRPTSANIS